MPPSRAEEDTSVGVLEGATPPPMSAIERGHRFLDPVAKCDFDRFGGTGDLLVRDGALVRGERREHVFDQVAHLSCRLGGRDADPQPREATWNPTWWRGFAYPSPGFPSPTTTRSTRGGALVRPSHFASRDT